MTTETRTAAPEGDIATLRARLLDLRDRLISGLAGNRDHLEIGHVALLAHVGGALAVLDSLEQRPTAER